jgi:hypothetical protein
LTKDKKDVKTMVFDDLLKAGPRIGDDGREVTMNPGDLVSVKSVDLMGRAAFHIANVGPGSATAQLQYEYILGRLKLGPKIAFQKAMLAADGQFRRLITDKYRKDN